MQRAEHLPFTVRLAAGESCDVLAGRDLPQALIDRLTTRRPWAPQLILHPSHDSDRVRGLGVLSPAASCPGS